MINNNPTEDPAAAADTSSIARRQRRGRRIAVTVVACTLLGGIAGAVTASSASAEVNDRCTSLTAVYEDQIIYVGDAFGAYTTDVLLEKWGDATVALRSYHAAFDESQTDYHAMQAACA